MQNFKTLFLIAILGSILFYSCKKDDPATGPEQYFPKVKKIIADNCLSCHLSTGIWEGRPTSFDTDTLITSGYAAIKASVVDPVTYTNKRMPQGGILSENDINTIVEWFNKGGKSTD